MKIVVVGGGAREHALASVLSACGHELLFTHENPGFFSLGTVRPVAPEVLAAGADLVVVGPEGPLADGLVDRLATLGVPAFGPTRTAAALECSKIFCKRFCHRHAIPTADFIVVEPGDTPVLDRPWVVKLDGLAAGKGVWVSSTIEQAQEALAAAQATHPGQPVLLEDRLYGPELSVLALCDGEDLVVLPPARDHKRRFNLDQGPNTGGMGAIAPVETSDLAACVAILRTTVAGMAAEGTPFRGALYGGFMLTPAGARLLEYNVRFGDPETQAILPLLAEDLAPWLLGAATGRLPGSNVKLLDAYACAVVIAAATYPEGRASSQIYGLPAESDNLRVYQGGTTLRADSRGHIRLWASGGRVLTITGLGADPGLARRRAYQGAAEVRFLDADWRTDIGAGPWS